MDSAKPITQETVATLADHHDWTTLDQSTDSANDEWAYTFQTPETGVTLTVDSLTHINGRPVNNICIESPLLRLTSLSDYYQLRGRAFRDQLGLKLFDNRVSFPRIAASPEAGPSSYPTAADITTLLTEAAWVGVRLTVRQSSTTTDCEDLVYWVSRVSTAVSQYQDPPSDGGS